MDCIDLFYYAYQLFRMNTVFMDKTIRTLNCKHTLLFAIWYGFRMSEKKKLPG